MDNKLLLFVKYPEPGRVKTRLGREIGHETACRIYEEMVKCQISDLTGGRYDLELYVDDSHSIGAYQQKFGKFLTCFYQKGNDLGERMDRAFTETFQRGASRAVLMGSDIPLMDEIAVASFFHHLDHGEMVIGPAMDGGYYMIGFKAGTKFSPVFQEISWSSPSVFDTTLSRAAGMRIHIEKMWFDVDTLQDLAIYHRLRRSGDRFSHTA